jgi:hypothetical protein
MARAGAAGRAGSARAPDEERSSCRACRVGVALAEGVDGIDQLGEAAEVVGREHLALEDREIELEQRLRTVRCADGQVGGRAATGAEHRDGAEVFDPECILFDELDTFVYLHSLRRTTPAPNIVLGDADVRRRILALQSWG